MNTIFQKGAKKFNERISSLNNLSKNIIKYGVNISLALLIAALFLMIYNHYTGAVDEYLIYIGQNITKTSFIVLAEVIIGALAADFIISDNK